MMSEQCFQERLNKLIRAGRETAGLDAKKELYLSTNKLSAEKPQKVFSFVSDAIAFANWSRRTGQAGYVLFGVRDGTWESVGLDLVNDWNLGSKYASLPKLSEAVRHKYLKVVEQYINHPLSVDFDLVQVDGLYFGLMVIRAFAETPSAYCSKQALQADRPNNASKSFPAGSVWIRWGDKTQQVKPSLVGSLCSNAEVPYILPENWINLAMSQAAHLDSDEVRFEIPVQNDQRPALYAIETALDANDGVAVIGRGGSGKSTLLKEICQRRAQLVLESGLYLNRYGDRMEAYENADVLVDPGDLEVRPDAAVPVYLSLRLSIHNADQLAACIRDQIMNYSRISSPNYSLESYLRIPGSRWLFVLDGLEEASPIEQIGPALALLVDRTKAIAGDRVRWLVSARPDLAAAIKPSFFRVELASPSIDVVRLWLHDLARQRLAERQSDHLHQALDQLNFFMAADDVVELLRVPRWVDAYARVWLPRANVEIDGAEEHQTMAPVGLLESQAREVVAGAQPEAKAEISVDLAVEPASDELDTDGNGAVVPTGSSAQPGEQAAAESDSIGQGETNRLQQHLTASRPLAQRTGQVALDVQHILNEATRLELMRKPYTNADSMRVYLRLLAWQVVNWGLRAVDYLDALNSPRRIPEGFFEWWGGIGVITPHGDRGPTRFWRFPIRILHEVIAAEHWCDMQLGGSPEYLPDIAHIPEDVADRIRQYKGGLCGCQMTSDSEHSSPRLLA